MNSQPNNFKKFIAHYIQKSHAMFEQIPQTGILLLGRFSIAAVFWKAGQTKINGLVFDFINGDVQLGWPHLSESALELFKTEYHLPLLSPPIAALMAAFAEHFFSLLLLLGLATRFSAFALLMVTLTIQLFVYPDAYPTHGTWAVVLLWLMAKGAGTISIDHWILNILSPKVTTDTQRQ